MDNDALRVPKLAELIADSIRDDITGGRFPVGRRLPSENYLMSAFDASRPSVREALRVLEFEQLIVVRRGAHGGAEVTQPHPGNVGVRIRTTAASWKTDATEAADLLAGAEIAAVRSLALRGTETSIQPLLSAAASGAEFHHQLLTSSGLPLSRALGVALESLQSELTCGGSAAHTSVVRAIRLGDPHRAVTRWRTHQDEIRPLAVATPKAAAGA